MVVLFDTRDYEFAHGKKPRGEGRWAFSEKRDAPGGDPAVIWCNGSYSAAKRQAAAVARERGIGVLHVLS